MPGLNIFSIANINGCSPKCAAGDLNILGSYSAGIFTAKERYKGGYFLRLNDSLLRVLLGDISNGISNAATFALFRNNLRHVAAHEFSGANEQSDLSRFECLDYDEFTGTYSARACSCGDYNIFIHASDDAAAHIFSGHISTNLAATRGTIVIDGELSVAGEAELTNKPYIIQFGAYSTSQTCQRALYVGFSDEDGLNGDGVSSDRWQ